MGRKAEYPSINFIQSLQDNEMKIYKKFPELDYISLCVGLENTHAEEHYRKIGFSGEELIAKGFRDKTVLYMSKKISQRDGIVPPTYSDINLEPKRV